MRDIIKAMGRGKDRLRAKKGSPARWPEIAAIRKYHKHHKRPVFYVRV